jgi:hypothetical protein
VKPVNRDDLPRIPAVENMKNGSLLGVEPKSTGAVTGPPAGVTGPTGFIVAPTNGTTAPATTETTTQPKTAPAATTPTTTGDKPVSGVRPASGTNP